MSRYRYSSFGLNIASDFQIDGLLDPVCAPEIKFRLGQTLPPQPHPDPQFSSSVGASQCLFHVGGVALFTVSHGDDIFVEPFPGMEDDAMRLFLMTNGLGTLLHERLTPALHGSAVVTSRGTVVFAGASGSGKSSIAARCCQQGLQVLSDEISVLQQDAEAVRVLPGPPWLLLWQDSLDQLGVDPSGLRPIRRGLRKFYFPLGHSHESSPAPLWKVYSVESSPEKGYAITRLNGLKKFEVIASALYRPSVIEQMSIAGDYLPQIAEIAARVEVSRLRVPHHSYNWDDLMVILEQDWA